MAKQVVVHSDRRTKLENCSPLAFVMAVPGMRLTRPLKPVYAPQSAMRAGSDPAAQGFFGFLRTKGIGARKTGPVKWRGTEFRQSSGIASVTFLAGYNERCPRRSAAQWLFGTAGTHSGFQKTVRIETPAGNVITMFRCDWPMAAASDRRCLSWFLIAKSPLLRTTGVDTQCSQSDAAEAIRSRN